MVQKDRELIIQLITPATSFQEISSKLEVQSSSKVFYFRNILPGSSTIKFRVSKLCWDNSPCTFGGISKHRGF